MLLIGNIFRIYTKVITEIIKLYNLDRIAVILYFKASNCI